MKKAIITGLVIGSLVACIFTSKRRVEQLKALHDSPMFRAAIKNAECKVKK